MPKAVSKNAITFVLITVLLDIIGFGIIIPVLPRLIESIGEISLADAAVMAGWMLTIILLARGPFISGERYAWNAIAWPLTGWYLVDTCFSLAHGVWGNVLLNTATALMFGIPLFCSRRLFPHGA